MDPQIELARKKLIDLAKFFVGVKETEPNKGPLIELFQKAVDGKAEGEPYCVGFCHFLVQQIDLEMKELNPKWPRHILWKTENSKLLWDMAKTEARHSQPQPGDIIVWNFWKDGRLSRSGHAGIVAELLEDGRIKTYEANTSDPNNKIVREGDGVYEKVRSIFRTDTPMRYLGCISPWV